MDDVVNDLVWPRSRQGVSLASRQHIPHSRILTSDAKLTFITRSRRVKCGEEKPECQRCIKFGITCAGYRPARAPKVHVRGVKTPTTQPRSLIPKSASTLNSLILEISENWFESQDDYVYFQTFCTKTVFDILPTYQSKDLQQILLQTCASCSSIRGAVSALGALDKTSSIDHSLNYLPPDDERKREAHQHHQNAVRAYSKAVRQMREDASRGIADIRTVLLTCLVTMCFEAWNGNHALAVRQICLGLRLINAWKYDNPQIHMARSGSTKEMEDGLVIAFSRLDIQVVPLIQDSVKGFSAFSQEDELLALESMPLVLSTMDEVEKYETILIRRCMRFYSIDIGLASPAPTGHDFPLNGWWGVKTPEVLTKQQKHIASIRHWLAAVDPMWNQLGCAEFNGT